MSAEKQADVIGNQADEVTDEERRAIQGAAGFVSNIREGNKETGSGEQVCMAWYVRGVAGGLSALYHLAKRQGNLPSEMYDLLAELHTELGIVLEQTKRGRRG